MKRKTTPQVVPIETLGANQRARADRLRQAGLRATAPRLEILEAIEGDRRHPTAEMIHAALRDRFPSLSLSTVYATMEAFAQRGLVRRIASIGGSQRIDGTLQDHDHAVCRVCGDVFDIERSLTDRPTPPTHLPFGLQLENVFIEYEVLCARCLPGSPVDSDAARGAPDLSRGNIRRNRNDA